MRRLTKERGPDELPGGVTLEKPGTNLDSLTQTESIRTLKSTLMHEWGLRSRFKDVSRYGIKPTTMALFYGPPGNGKTMSAKMLAAHINSPLYRVSCDGLLGSHLGKSERNMKDVMDWLAKAGQCVVLFDECEALFQSRGRGGGECTRAIASTMQVFWQAVDRWETPQMFLLATNIRDEIDPALLSRCEIQIEFAGPTEEDVEMVMAYWCETLHEYGSEVWGPALLERYRKRGPASFRELWQAISYAVRQFIITQ